MNFCEECPFRPKDHKAPGVTDNDFGKKFHVCEKCMKEQESDTRMRIECAARWTKEYRRKTRWVDDIWDEKCKKCLTKRVYGNNATEKDRTLYSALMRRMSLNEEYEYYHSIGADKVMNTDKSLVLYHQATSIIIEYAKEQFPERVRALMNGEINERKQ